MTASAPLGEYPLSPVRGLSRGSYPSDSTRPDRSYCPSRGTPRPSWLPPDKFCCRQDHYLQGTYGITCDAYWGLFEAQGGRCAICGRAPGKKRLVVDHDHDTGTIDGLCHFACNRRLTSKLRRYLTDPPGRRLDLMVAPAKLREIQSADAAKRKRDRARAMTKLEPPSEPSRSSSEDVRARIKAALEATKQEGG